MEEWYDRAMKATFIIIVLLLLGGGGFALYKTQHTSSPTTSGKLTVAASFYPLAEFSRQITGDRADITTITPAGAEPHDYEPTPQDIIAIRTAKAFFYNGSGVESWAQKAWLSLILENNVNQYERSVFSASRHRRHQHH